MSPLAWGRGLKQQIAQLVRMNMRSPLAWGRGLKLLWMHRRGGDNMSPLAWGRGLKLLVCVHLCFECCRPSRGGVD